MKKYIKNLNPFILSILLLLGFAVVYFLFHRIRNQTDIYITVSLSRQITVPLNPDAQPSYFSPYWIAESIKIGDKENSPFGGEIAEVTDKETYEGPLYSRLVYLTLKIKSIKDRSGTYLFKNKPLLVGGPIDLKLTKSTVSGVITYIGKNSPEYKEQKFKVVLMGKGVDFWVADNLKIGSEINNDNRQVIAKVIDKKITPSSSISMLSLNDAKTGSTVAFDITKRDLEVTVEITAKKIGDSYYFGRIQKIKVDEPLYLPFKEVTLNHLPITSVTEIK